MEHINQKPLNQVKTNAKCELNYYSHIILVKRHPGEMANEREVFIQYFSKF